MAKEYTLEEIGEIAEKGMLAVDALRKTVDEMDAEIKTKGAADPLLQEKIDRIEKGLETFDDVNQQITKQAEVAKAVEEHQKAMEEQIKAQAEQIGTLETAAKRLPVGNPADGRTEADVLYSKAFEDFCRHGIDDVKADHLPLLTERKALIMGEDTQGGYYAAPAMMETEIIKAIIEVSPFRALARVTQIGSRSLLLPKRTGVFAARRVAEEGPRTETEGYQTGMNEITAPEMFADVRISLQMIEDSQFDIESEIQTEMTDQFAIKEGQEAINGNDAGEMEGILSAAGTVETNSLAAAAIASATGAEADGLINLYHALKTGYAVNATWIMNRLSLRDIRKLKDANEQYVWIAGIADLRPNTILGSSYTEMPDMPDVAANAYPIAFGDWARAYRIVDRVGMSVLRDPFTLAGDGKIKLLGRRRVGGAVVQAEAIAKLKIST